MEGVGLTKKEAAALLCDANSIDERKVHCLKCPLLPSDGCCTGERYAAFKSAIPKLCAYIEGEPK